MLDALKRSDLQHENQRLLIFLLYFSNIKKIHAFMYESRNLNSVIRGPEKLSFSANHNGGFYSMHKIYFCNKYYLENPYVF